MSVLLDDLELDIMNDAAAEPLIPSTRHDFPTDARDRYSSDNNDDTEPREDEVDESALVSPGVFIWTLTICAGVSGLLFGYEYVSV
jgi:SP family myo-inositol transporter-like MFS transporter 13